MSAKSSEPDAAAAELTAGRVCNNQFRPFVKREVMAGNPNRAGCRDTKSDSIERNVMARMVDTTRWRFLGLSL
jgi:hypothetical protein